MFPYGGQNGISLALASSASTFICIVVNRLNGKDGRFLISGVGRMRVRDRLARSRIREKSYGLNQHQMGSPYSAGILPAGISRIMSEQDLLRYIETLENIILKKQQKIATIEAGPGMDVHSRCIAFSMSMPVREIQGDISRLERELGEILAVRGSGQSQGGTDKNYDPEYCFDLLGHMSYHAKILDELVESIIEGKWTIPPKNPSGELNEIVSHWIKRMKDGRSFDPGTRINLKLNRYIPKLSMRDSEIFQIVYHLLNNAVEALPSRKDGEITVKTDISEKYLLLEVMDNGYGIRKEIRDKVFTPFYSTKQQGEEKRSHPGLGLFIAGRIVEEYGGRIDLQSEQGIGTVISVFLPINEKAYRSSGSPGDVMDNSPPTGAGSRNIPEGVSD